MASLRVSCVVALMCMVVVTAPIAEAAITCGSVSGAVSPCISFLKGGPGPSPNCCGGVRALNAAARTPLDRKTACNCLKTASGAIPGLKPQNVASLPGKCGVRLPYTISPSTNCNGIRF